MYRRRWIGLRPFRNAHAHFILPRDCGLAAQGSTKQAIALIYCDRALFESPSRSCTGVLVQLLFVSGGIAAGFTLNLAC